MVVRTGDWRILHDYRATSKGRSGRCLFRERWPTSHGRDRGRGLFLARGRDGYRAGHDRHRSRLSAPPGEMSNGERQFQRKCSICHSLEADGARKAGPTLDGVFGRRAGALAGYTYSDTLEGSDIVWDETTIDRLFDLGPDHYIPGSKMPMQRIVKPEDRRDLVEWLKQNT